MCCTGFSNPAFPVNCSGKGGNISDGTLCAGPLIVALQTCSDLSLAKPHNEGTATLFLQLGKLRAK